MPANIPAYESFAGMARSYGRSKHLDTSSNTKLEQSLVERTTGYIPGAHPNRQATMAGNEPR